MSHPQQAVREAVHNRAESSKAGGYTLAISSAKLPKLRISKVKQLD